MAWAVRPATSRTSVTSSTGSGSRRSRPARMRETSSRSSASWASRRTVRRTGSLRSRAAGVASTAWSMNSVCSTSAPSGVRSSCPATDRKSSRARIASRARS